MGSEFQHPQWHVVQKLPSPNPFPDQRVLRLDDDCSECDGKEVYCVVGDDGLPDGPSWCPQCTGRDVARDAIFGSGLYYFEPGDGTRYLFSVTKVVWQDSPNGWAWLYTFGPNRQPLFTVILPLQHNLGYGYVRSKFQTIGTRDLSWPSDYDCLIASALLSGLLNCTVKEVPGHWQELCHKIQDQVYRMEGIEGA
jgi:hypothetical protein